MNDKATEKFAHRTTPKPLLDRAYWLSRPIEERFAAIHLESSSRARAKDKWVKPGLLGIAEVLNATGIGYLVIGGYALAAHGMPRMTSELDIWIDAHRDDICRVLDALGRFGFGSLDLSDSHLGSIETLSRRVRLEDPPVRIDVLTAIDGVRFAECHARRVMMAMGDVPLPVIELADLRTNKRAAGRARDLLDLANLDEAIAA